ncbi:YbhB/YbcL family Raf kinase inhibitor-like protein [Acrocarpospora catenulata]|uniref:YbhB/YbcL family Raf kinase inhibitor-like protein n=1 Tax=Acrocarpospora catenulata TaxID=2836182 RepID=UPI001BDB49DF|nr:YbhB/YbcL family Raf kinase inhibitor-like protein [Acrocarpospora catenulata]
MKIGKLGVVGGVLFLANVLPGCSAEGGGSSEALKVSSPAFAEGTAMPQKYACARQGGEDVSPPLTWSGVPDSAAELAIVVNDKDARGGTYIHWIVTGIPTSATGATEGQAPGQVLPGTNSKAAYAGPCPSTGDHHYQFIVYALKSAITPNGGARAVHEQIKEAAITSGETVGTWKRG